MKIYQFIKYNGNTTLKHIKIYNKNQITCFDFEDGIQNIKNPYKTSELKAEHRKYFISIYNKLVKTHSKIGIRLNTNDYEEFKKDIICLKNLDIHSIFLPKIENSEQLLNQISVIKQNKIRYSEIIPVIENKKGLLNLDKILKDNNIKSIAFGHCDYNLNQNIFPFFHQENFEYWKWVKKIVDLTNKHKVCFINSPYLQLNNTDFFFSMLKYLKEITHDNFGQISISTRHTKLTANIPSEKNKDFTKLLKNRLQLYPNKTEAEELIYNFEVFNTGKGLTKYKNYYISYQEYISAKNHFKKRFSKTINLAFIGGCFPVQHNILYEDIFLTLIKTRIEKTSDIELQADIIRYERFYNVLDKIKKLHSERKIDILIFSIRPEPYLRLIKLYYKYMNNKGKVKHSLNLPLLNIINPEKYDYLILGKKYGHIKNIKRSRIHKILIDMNYLAGYLLGNKFFALKKYIELIEIIKGFCIKNNIKLILLGPNLRNNTSLEPYICKDLDITAKTTFNDIKYIPGLDKYYNEQYVFKENGIHVNEVFHRMISDRIVEVLKNENF